MDRKTVSACADRIAAYAFSVDLTSHMGIPDAPQALRHAEMLVRQLAPAEDSGSGSHVGQQPQ